MPKGNNSIKGKISRKTNLILLIITLLFLLLSKQGCTDITNPFHPQSTTGGDPFELKAVPQFGRIDLEWKVPETGNPSRPFNFDFYQIFRKTENESWSRIDSTTKLTYQDSTVENAKLYSYRISAWRGSEQSDFSSSVTTLPCWYPDTSEVVVPFLFNEPVDIAFCEICNRRYIVDQLTDQLVILDQFDQLISILRVGLYPTSVDFWHDDFSGKDIVITCNLIGRSLSIVAEDSLGNYNEILRRDTGIHLPQSVKISTASRKAYLSFRDTDWLIRMNLESFPVEDTLFVEGSLKRLQMTNDSKILLGVDEANNEVAIIDLVQLILTRVAVEERPVDIAIHPNQNLAYVACEYDTNYQGLVRINVVDYLIPSRVPEREVIIPRAGEIELFRPQSVTIVPGCLDDGLLFVAVGVIRSDLPETRIYGYHIGPNIMEPVKTNVICNEFPLLVRRVPSEAEKKLYVLHINGIHTFF